MSAATAARVGLEIHARLRTRSKLFCACAADYGAPPNSRTCPVCLGLPGSLPVLNGRAVELALRVALAVGARPAPRSAFARKSYFYPDLPRNYQITQYERPLAVGGALALGAGPRRRRVRIERLHLEEDAGRLLHGGGGPAAAPTRVDLNRAGTPLLEIVTAPDLRDGEEAAELLRRLRRLLLHLEACDGNLEEGSLRCDANVSLGGDDAPGGGAAASVRPGAGAGRPPGAPPGLVEIKNLNSFGALRRAVAHEIERQGAVLAAGGRIERQTRGWDATGARTVFLRSKERAHDYRYFPEPDLPPLVVAEALVERVARSLPEPPEERARRLAREHGLSRERADLLCETPELAGYFEAVAADLAGGRGDGPGGAGKGGPAAEGSSRSADAAAGRLVAGWLATEVLGHLRRAGLTVESLPVPPGRMARLLRLIRDGVVSRRAAREVLAAMLATGQEPEALVRSLGLERTDDPAELTAAAAAVLAAHPDEVAAYLRGRRGLLAFFMGRLMGRTEGRADPQAARRALLDLLDGLK